MDLIGKQFGWLIVQNLKSERIKGCKQYDCLCTKCGNRTVKTRNVLVTGNSKSCSRECGISESKFKPEEYIGKRYNDLTCIEYTEYKGSKQGHFFKFKCEREGCLNIVERPINNVKSGNTTYCGECKYKINIGDKFGTLTVVDDKLPKNKYGHLQFKVECDCGNENIIITRSHLLNAKICGDNHESIIGKIFGRLTVLEKCKEFNDDGRHDYKCQCSCKERNITYVTKGNLISGRTRSCSCLNSEVSKERHKEYRKSKGFDENTSMSEKSDLIRGYLFTLQLKGLILKIDSYSCQYCGTHSSSLHIHHVIPVMDFFNIQDEKTYNKFHDINNLVSLCDNCHERAHGYNYRNIDIEIQKDLIDIISKRKISDKNKKAYKVITNKIVNQYYLVKELSK